MKVNRITLREIRLPLVDFFETSFGRTQERRVLLVELQGGATRWAGVNAWRAKVLFTVMRP